MNSSIFNWRLKDASEDNDVRDLDKLFHVRAAATGKERTPAVERRVGGTTSVDVDEERRRWRAARFDTRSRSQDKYDGARPFRQRKTSTESLNSIRCSILSQCSSWRSGVTWSIHITFKIDIRSTSNRVEKFSIAILIDVDANPVTTGPDPSTTVGQSPV